MTREEASLGVQEGLPVGSRRAGEASSKPEWPSALEWWLLDRVGKPHPRTERRGRRRSLQSPGVSGRSWSMRRRRDDPQGPSALFSLQNIRQTVMKRTALEVCVLAKATVKCPAMPLRASESLAWSGVAVDGPTQKRSPSGEGKGALPQRKV